MATWIDRAKQRMKILGLKQKDLIRPLKVDTRGAVGHYLTGRRKPDLDQVMALADVLECQVGWLLAGENPQGDRQDAFTPAEIFEAIGRATPKQIDGILDLLGLRARQVPAPPPGQFEIAGYRRNKTAPRRQSTNGNGK